MKTLKELREAQGLTQFDLAVKSQVSLSYVQKIEQGLIDHAGGDIQKKIARVLGDWPIEFIGDVAYWVPQLYDEPNPILRNPWRKFANNLLSAVTKNEDSAGQMLVENCRAKKIFKVIQDLHILAKKYGIPWPENPE
jgi:DNA-binding XRE family transcriptional regulator